MGPLDPVGVSTLDDLEVRGARFGYDDFGMHPTWVRRAYRAAFPVYSRYFRVQASNAQVLGRVSGAILACNHSGTLPIDGAMLWMDVLTRTSPSRVARPISDVFVPRLPWVSLVFARNGVIAGTRGNVQRMLHRGEMLMIFPEGAPGIDKPYSKRYQLQSWRVGHAELAIRHQVPIIPIGIIGAEEATPKVALVKFGLFGIKHLPIPAAPLPLPARIHIHYGEPIDFSSRYCADDADDPEVVRAAAAEVRDAVAGLIARGLLERDGVFR